MSSERNVVVECHPLTNDPDRAWSELSSCRMVGSVDPLPVDTPVRDDSVRFVCVSDTHSKISVRLKELIPDGDVLLHAGDFTTFGDYAEVRRFNDFLGTLPHRYKVVIAGNHEISFDRAAAERFNIYSKPRSGENLHGYRDPRELLTNCTYLEDSSIDIHGITIYGSPWTPIYMDWAFSLPRGEACLKKWNKIPENVDVLLTHGPPLGYGDYTISSVRAGCVELLLSVQQRIKPKYHVYGHIHEGHGVRSDGTTTYVNCSVCDVNYRPVQHPIIFDLPLKNGFKKS